MMEKITAYRIKLTKSFFSYRDGAMIRVVGNPRDYEGKRHLLVYNVAELKDWNELSHHVLEVIYTHLLLTQQVKVGVSDKAAAQGQFVSHFNFISDAPLTINPFHSHGSYLSYSTVIGRVWLPCSSARRVRWNGSVRIWPQWVCKCTCSSWRQQCQRLDGEDLRDVSTARSSPGRTTYHQSR